MVSVLWDKRGEPCFYTPGQFNFHGKEHRRKAANVVAVESVWLDVDAGEEKGYADKEQARAAINEFTEAPELQKILYIQYS